MKLGWASLARFGQPSKTLDSIKLDKAAYLQFVSPLLQLLPRKSSQLYLKKKIRGRHGIGEASTSWRWVWAVASSQKRITGRGKGQDAVEHKPLYRTSPATAGQPRWSTRRSGPHLVAFASCSFLPSAGARPEAPRHAHGIRSTFPGVRWECFPKFCVRLSAYYSAQTTEAKQVGLHHATSSFFKTF